MTANQNQQNFNPEDVFGGESYQEFLEGPKSQVEYLGDLHSNDQGFDSDIENYAGALMEKYNPEDELGRMIITGDLVTNLGAKANIDELLEENPQIVDQKAEKYVRDIYRTRQVLEEVNNYFENDLDILVKEGNHTTTRGAHGEQADKFSEIVEEKASEMIEGFSQYEGSLDQFVFEDSETVDLVNYDARKIGDTTYVFGGAGWKNEIDPMVLEHGVEMLYDEDQLETRKEEWEPLREQEGLLGSITRSLGPIGSVIDKAYNTYKSVTADVEEYVPEENMTSEHIEYEQGLEKLEQAYEKAAELGGENTVFVSHQGPNSFLEEDYTIDEFDQAPVPQGNVAEAKFLEDKQFDGILIGHHHGGAKTEFNDTPLLNLGAGQSTPGNPQNITETPVYNPEDTPDFKTIGKLDRIEQEGIDQHYDQRIETLQNNLQEALEEERIEEEQYEEELRRMEEQFNAEKEYMKALSEYRDEEKNRHEIETPEIDASDQAAEAQTVA